MPRDLKQVRALLGGVGCYGKFLRDLSMGMRPITSLLRKGSQVRVHVRHGGYRGRNLAKLAAPPMLVFPGWDAIAEGSRSFRVYCDAFIDSFGAALEQEQTDGSVRPISYISRAIVDSQRHWTPLDLEAGSIGWAIKRLRGYLWGTKFRIFSDHKALKSIGKLGDCNARAQRWLEFLTAFDRTLEYRKGNPNGNVDFLSRLAEPATEHDRSGSSSLTPVDVDDIFFIPACGLRTRSSPTPGIGLGGLVSRPENAVLGGLPFAFSGFRNFRDFRAHGPRTRLTTSLLLLGDSSLVYLPPSPPSIAVPTAEFFSCRRHRFPLGFCRAL